MQDLPTLLPTNIALSDEQIATNFLGGLIDQNDLREGPFRLYTDMRSFQAFSFDPEKVGFPGGFGIYENIYPSTNEGRITLCLWPRLPARDTPSGHIDVFDPDPILKLTWMIERQVPHGLHKNEHSRFPWVLNRMEVILKSSNIHTRSLDYAIKILMRAREIWPQT